MTGEVLLGLLGVALVVNASLLVMAIARSRDARPPAGPWRREDVGVASAIEAFLAGATEVAADSRASAEGQGSGSIEAAVVAERIEGRRWDQIVREEAARFDRFRAPVAVLIADLSGLDAVAERLGTGPADAVRAEADRIVGTQGRLADRSAWLGRSTFGSMLVGADAAGAAAYAARLRVAIDSWLESAGLSVRLSVGLATTAAEFGVGDAVAAAREAMLADRRGLTAESVRPARRDRAAR
ncbi:MAG: hypothetical protein ACJ761_10350 [Chloroflexota bacterium]